MGATDPSMRRALTLLVGLSSLASCQLVGGFSEFTGGGEERHPCDVLDPKSRPGMVLIKLPDIYPLRCFWIDKEEASVAEYQAFLATKVEWASFPFCAWKTSLSDPVSDPTVCEEPIPTNQAPPFAPEKPIRCVDWCDARAFCQSAGKDLCSINYQQNGTSFAQWELACGASPGDPFPTGASYGGECNAGVDSVCIRTGCGPLGPTLFPKCTTPAGAHNMIGNVREWVSACDTGDPGPTVSCHVMGGSSRSKVDSTLTCSRNADSLARNRRLIDVGFRCCAALSASELASIGG